MTIHVSHVEACLTKFINIIKAAKKEEIKYNSCHWCTYVIRISIDFFVTGCTVKSSRFSVYISTERYDTTSTFNAIHYVKLIAIINIVSRFP